MVERVDHKRFYSRAMEIFMEEYRKATDRKGEFTVALSGGDTPKPLFKLLAQEKIDWKKIHIFMVDERYLSLDHPDSNYGNLYRELLSQVDIPHDNVTYIKHLESLECSRIEYQFELEEFFRERGRGFDLIFLGMGRDGHTASLFPDNVDIEETVVPSLKSDYHNYSRISLGIGAINDCNKKVFLLTKEKKEILGKMPGGDYPASRVTGDVLYLLEE